MNRVMSHRVLFSGSVATLLLAHGPLRADVLEVSAEGANWVAGGPVAMAQWTPPSPPEALVEGPATGQIALTEADDSAGPEMWRSHVAMLAAKYDISPALLEAMVWQESRWNTRAVSSAGAQGLAQLMPGTARQMGVNSADPAANLEGGARYLREQLDRFNGDVEKALAAYNAGPARVAAAGGIPDIRETKAYVAAIMGRLSSQSTAQQTRSD
jgi:soluble lytic murein transglycosylase-like protein